MANNNERMIFGIGFDLATGVDEVIKQWEGKESKRLQKVLDKKPLKISLEIKKNFITELRDFVKVTREVANAQRQINKAKKDELDIAAKAATVKTREANQRAANVRAAVQEATQQDQINKKKADAAYSEERLAQAKKNGIAVTNAQNTAYKTQSNYLSRLVTRMVAYFSIHQVFNFLRQIREVTAEFELQRVALGALIQDTNKANVIFEQIKVQAIKSPYEIKDLVTYTKQLAAYGVEADELMGTMNRLADISAGLGTDMNRIILAYGQIQAAGVLKGTELRQLTELGLPMVDLLAEYYSVLRDEVVTTSEVFDMISKKEIPFEAVQDIFEDLTSEGGRFYEMQSKQAETLAGQWSNMQDALSIMFDEIGRSEEVRSLLEGMIDTVKWLALNWRIVWEEVKTVAYVYGGLKVGIPIIRALTASTISVTKAKKAWILAERKHSAIRSKTLRFLSLETQLTRLSAFAMFRMAKASNAVTAGLWKMLGVVMRFISANLVGTIMGIVGALGIFRIATSDGIDAMEAFKQRQREMVKESVQNTATLVTNFKQLANEVINSADGSERQRQALRRLKQQYGEIFPEWKLTVDYLRKISEEADGVSDSFSSMISSIRSFAAEEMRFTLLENYSKQLEEHFSDVFTALTDNVGANYSKVLGYILDQAGKGVLNRKEFFKDIKEMYDEIAETELVDVNGTMLEVSSIDPDKNDLRSILLIADALVKANGDIEQMMRNFDNLDPRLATVNTQMEELGKRLKEIDEETGGETAGDVEANIKSARKEAIDAAARQLLTDEIQSVADDIPLDDIIGALEDIIGNLDDVTLDKIIGNLEPIKSVVENRGLEISDAFYSGINSLRGFAGDYDDIWREDLDNMVEYLDDGKRKVKAYASDEIQAFGSLSDALPKVAERYDELNDGLVQLKKTSDALTAVPINEQDTKEIENYRREISKTEAIMRHLYDFLEKYGGLDLLKDKDKKKKKVNPEIKQLEDELAMVEKIYKKYEEYRKTMGDAEARALVEQYFEGVDLKWLDKAFSTTELKEQAQEALRIIKTFWGDTKEAEQNIQFKIGDIDYNETKRELEQKMKKLSDDISRTKTAKEFFDKMLGMTGDKELSATLTLSVYGTTGDDLQKLMVQQVEEAFRNLPKDINFDSARLYGKNSFDYNILAGWIEKLPEDDRKAAQSIVDNWRKANADILSDIQKSYEEFITYEERRTRVAEKYSAERKKIMESELPDDEKEKYVKAANKRENKELADIAIEEFKASEDWAKSFEDLENLATPTIERLMAKLKEFIDTQKDLTPEQLKTLTNEYKKLYEGLITRNPFQALTDGIKEYQQARDEVITAGIGVDTAKANVETTQEELRIASERKAIAEQNFRTSTDTARAGREYAEAIKLYNQAAENASKAEQALTDAERNQTDAMDNQRKAYSKIEKSLDGIQNKFLQAEQLVQSFTETLGISEDSDFGAFLNGMAESFGGVAKAIAFAQLAMQLFDGTIKTFLTSNPIGWILLIVSAIISAVQAIMNVRVKRIDREIERLQDRLDQLEYSYERLQKAQEKAFGSDYISNYEQRLANLQAQQEAYLKQAEAERSKGKKADEDKIKEYEEQARETADAIKDMQSELSEYFLGTDLTSAARDFANAWIDAYKEFANTTDAMKEKFQDMIQNMIVESLIAKVMERALKPVFEMVENMGDSDFYSNSFWSQLMTEMNKATENGVVGAQNIMGILESIGINLRDTGTGLTGISRDIASASEESILGLAAGINTQNFYISQVPTKLDTIIGLLRGGSAVVDSGVNVQDLITIQNQFLSHLPTIAQNTAETVARCERAAVACESMASKLGSVIKPKGTTSTHSVNVTIGS